MGYVLLALVGLWVGVTFLIATAIFVTVAILRETGPQLSEPVSWRS